MHHHHWDSIIHFPLAAAWMSMPWWLGWFEELESGDHFLIVLAPYLATLIAILQIAYLIRKHRWFGKK